MSEVISGKNLTTIVLTESERLSLVSCLFIISQQAKRGSYEEQLCYKLNDLFEALGVRERGETRSGVETFRVQIVQDETADPSLGSEVYCAILEKKVNDGDWEEVEMVCGIVGYDQAEAESAQYLRYKKVGE